MADVPTTCFVKAQYSEHLDFMQSHSLVNKAHLSENYPYLMRPMLRGEISQDSMVTKWQR